MCIFSSSNNLKNKTEVIIRSCKSFVYISQRILGKSDKNMTQASLTQNKTRVTELFHITKLYEKLKKTSLEITVTIDLHIVRTLSFSSFWNTGYIVIPICLQSRFFSGYDYNPNSVLSIKKKKAQTSDLEKILGNYSAWSRVSYVPIPVARKVARLHHKLQEELLHKTRGGVFHIKNINVH